MVTKATPSQPQPVPTFQVRFTDTDPELVPLRAVSDALSAIQDLASGRDPFLVAQVPEEKVIGLYKISRGSAVYECVSRAPVEALRNLRRVGSLMGGTLQDDGADDVLVAALKPLESLSDVAKRVGCLIEVYAHDTSTPLLIVQPNAFKQISERLLITGETTITGKLQRVGGSTKMKCTMRVTGRDRLLYCSVVSKELAQKLGQHLYEPITATGIATWIHHTWRIYSFTIIDFTQPSISSVEEMLNGLREAGLNAWDSIENPTDYLREFKS